MANSQVEQIFEPFFTSKRGQGGQAYEWLLFIIRW